jgi:hypothetical protein
MYLYRRATSVALWHVPPERRTRTVGRRPPVRPLTQGRSAARYGLPDSLSVSHKTAKRHLILATSLFCSGGVGPLDTVAVRTHHAHALPPTDRPLPQCRVYHYYN